MNIARLFSTCIICPSISRSLSIFVSARRNKAYRGHYTERLYRSTHTGLHIQVYTYRSYRSTHTGLHIQVYTYRSYRSTHTGLHIQVYTYRSTHTGHTGLHIQVYTYRSTQSYRSTHTRSTQSYRSTHTGLHIHTYMYFNSVFIGVVLLLISLSISIVVSNEGYY